MRILQPGGVLKNIQTLRFVAAICVVLYHMQPPLTAFSAKFLPGKILGMGFCGVDLFFVISGFIMAETTRSLQSGVATGTHFVFKRFARIYAGWWPYFLLYLLANRNVVSNHPDIDLLGSFFLWPLHVNQYLVPVTWTLSFELYFYLFLGAVLVVSRRHAVWFVGAAGLLILLSNAWFVWFGFYGPRNGVNATLLHKFYAYSQVVEFVAGFLLAERVSKNSRMKIWPWAVGVFFFGLCSFYYQHYMNLFGSGMAGYFYAPERAVLLGGFSTCTVAIACAFEDRGVTPFAKLQEWGDASYSIYLGHIGVISLMSALYLNLLQRDLRVPDAIFGIVTLFAVVGAGAISYRWVEKPLTIRAKQVAKLLSAHRFS